VTASDKYPGIEPGGPISAGTLFPGEPLTLSDRAEIEALIAPLLDGLSEYSFANLFAFRERHEYRFQRGELPCVAGVTHDGERHLMPLFDVASVDADRLKGRLAGHDCYFPLSDNRSSALNPAQFSVVASPDDADYVYDAANFVDYDGSELDPKRSEVQQLLRHGRPVAVPFGRSSVPAALKVLEASLDDTSGRSAMSYTPSREAVENAAELGLEGHLYFLNEEPIGFLLGRLVADQMMAVHFAKARAGLPGVQAMMFHHAATVLAGRVKWFNFEQDLGHSDSREVKQAYQPTTLLKKHRARPTARR
jgi:hypothetical protein